MCLRSVYNYLKGNPPSVTMKTNKIYSMADTPADTYSCSFVGGPPSTSDSGSQLAVQTASADGSTSAAQPTPAGGSQSATQVIPVPAPQADRCQCPSGGFFALAAGLQRVSAFPITSFQWVNTFVAGLQRKKTFCLHRKPPDWPLPHIPTS